MIFNFTDSKKYISIFAVQSVTIWFIFKSRTISSKVYGLVLPNGTGPGVVPFNFYFPGSPGNGTDSARWYWLYNWPGQPPAEQSRRLIRHAAPSVYTAHDTHYTHSVAVLNLSWQPSGKLLVFLPIFAYLNLNCPLRNARGKPVSRLPFWITARQIIICGWATLHKIE